MGTFTKHPGQQSALAGVLAGITVMMFVWLRLDVSWQWYALLGSTVTFVVAVGWHSSK